MGKRLFIAEKPSVAKEFARVLGVKGKNGDGFIESEDTVVTWCVGHLVSMSYPEAYDPSLKRWSFDTIPFLPAEWKYEVIPAVKKQFGIVSRLLNREDVSEIYVCTDSGREGEYIYRLVRQESHLQGKVEKRVWIDSQTEEEIRRGISEAKDISAYDHIAESAYLRAKEDYLMGINFSRALTLRYSNVLRSALRREKAVVSVGRVMTCVLGMVVRREREIRDFSETPFYKINAECVLPEGKFTAEWKATEKSRYFQSPLLYKDNGFLKREEAEKFLAFLSGNLSELTAESAERKKEKKKPPLLFNLAELQNECSKRFKISPSETLDIVQALYEKKLVTYPRTDARVLSSAVAKEISKNLSGLAGYEPLSCVASEILQKKSYLGLEKTQYVDDRKITDHYAIIPTGQGGMNFGTLSPIQKSVYQLIARRFLAIFLEPAVYEKLALCLVGMDETFFVNFKRLSEQGYLRVYGEAKENAEKKSAAGNGETKGETEKDSGEAEKDPGETEQTLAEELLAALSALKKGDAIPVSSFLIKEGATTPPKRYNTGSLILAMENAGQLIEDEDLRAQIKGSGIGTSATRAEILKKLENIQYIKVNKKTQIVTPELFGEAVFEAVLSAIPKLLDPSLTASWEKGLSYVAEGSITGDEYMEKLSAFVIQKTERVKTSGNSSELIPKIKKAAEFYR